MRSWLTMLGIFIGIAAVVALISIGQGLQQAITQQFEQLGRDKITVQPGAMAFGVPGTSIGSAKLTQHDIDLIKRIKGVKEVAGVIQKIDALRYKDEVKYEFVAGLPFEAQELINEAQGYKIIEGRDLKQGDKYKAIIGYNLAYGTVFKKPILVGDSIQIGQNKQEVRVIGILDKTGNSFEDSAVILPFDTAKEVLGVGG